MQIDVDPQREMRVRTGGKEIPELRFAYIPVMQIREDDAASAGLSGFGQSLAPVVGCGQQGRQRLQAVVAQSRNCAGKQTVSAAMSKAYKDGPEAQKARRIPS